jgi:hypothetical protein
MDKVKYTARDLGSGIVINETECSKLKDIDEQLEHYRKCDKCYYELKTKIFDFANSSKGRILKTIILNFIGKDVKK